MTINEALTKLNTHTVFGVGLGTALTSVATIVLGPMVDTWLGTHQPRLSHVTSPFINIAIATAQAALPPAILAAAFGKPRNIPNDPPQATSFGTHAETAATAAASAPPVDPARA